MSAHTDYAREQNERTTWLAALVAGSKVAIVKQFSDPRRGTVSRVSKSSVWVKCSANHNPDYEVRFHVDSGTEVGQSGYYHTRIAPFSQEMEQEIRRKALVARLSAINFGSLTLSQLTEIDAGLPLSVAVSLNRGAIQS